MALHVHGFWIPPLPIHKTLHRQVLLLRSSCCFLFSEYPERYMIMIATSMFYWIHVSLYSLYNMHWLELYISLNIHFMTNHFQVTGLLVTHTQVHSMATNGLERYKVRCAADMRLTVSQIAPNPLPTVLFLKYRTLWIRCTKISTSYLEYIEVKGIPYIGLTYNPSHKYQCGSHCSQLFSS